MPCHNKLEAEIITCVRSAFIRSLAEFESSFGDLWGEGVEDDSLLSEDQLKADEIYEETRKRILDYGNRQIRIIKNVLSKYNIEQKGTTFVFLPKEKMNG